MKIGIIGLGIVGNACKGGFEKLGHVVKVHDIKLNTSLEDIMDTELVFLCVPTPSNDDGSCNISIVNEVVEDLYKKFYMGIVCIKSTVSPGTTDSLIKRFGNRLQITMTPEFLRERYALADFTENHDLCVIGTYSEKAFQKIKESHGNFPNKVVRMTPTEAELIKYFNNTYNATLITFANSFNEICRHYGVDYTKIKNVIINRSHINGMYLECNNNFGGFSGMCLPKDTKEIASVGKKIGVEFFSNILRENDKYKKTVQEGMRFE